MVLPVETVEIAPPLPLDSKGKNKERENLSGAACSPSGLCLLISDEMRFARLFTLTVNAPVEGKARSYTLIPGNPVYLLGQHDPAGESDGEGVVFDNGFFYVIGSHSNSRDGDPEPSRHRMFRIAVDPARGIVDVGTPAKPSTSLQGGAISLDYLIAGNPALNPPGSKAPGEFAPGRKDNNFKVDQHALNIEGVAVRQGKMFVGFRGPVDPKGAYLYELPVADLFAGKEPPGILHPPLKLHSASGCTGQGIRDLAAVSGGLLILSGPEMRTREPRTGDACEDALPNAEIFFWPLSGEPQRLAAIDVNLKGDSPEAVTVLEETDAAYRILLLSDGEGLSDPVILTIPKPARGAVPERG